MNNNFTRKIKMNVDDATEFAMVAAMCPFDISIYSNRCMADAKNVIELASMDFSKILTIEYNGYDSLFERYISRHVLAS